MQTPFEPLPAPDFPEPVLVPTNGVELEVFGAGEAHQRAIVLCHGWPEHAYSWRHQIAPLVDAGFHVLVPNQRGYGQSSRPAAVTDYDITHLTGDLVGLLNHYGYEDAIFVGHDWGALIVWNLAMMHRERVAGVANLSVPFMQRGTTEWISLWEQALGQDFYIVHFNRQPGVADEIFAKNSRQLLRNLYRTNQWHHPPMELEGMPMIAMANLADVPGDLIMSDAELQVFVDAFDQAGFTGGLNWYRNFSRNWEISGHYEQTITQPTLMIYGDYDMVPKSPDLDQVVADLEVHSLDCGHWVQQERPHETNALLLDWLTRRFT